MANCLVEYEYELAELMGETIEPEVTTIPLMKVDGTWYFSGSEVMP